MRTISKVGIAGILFVILALVLIVQRERFFSQADVATPPPPVNFTATAANNQVDLKWKKNPKSQGYAVNYRLFRKERSAAEYTRISQGILTATRYTDKGVSTGKSYSYRIVAVRDYGKKSMLSSARTASVSLIASTITPTPSPVAAGKRFFVSPSGKDSNDCLTVTTACRQIARTLGLVQPGRGDLISLAATGESSYRGVLIANFDKSFNPATGKPLTISAETSDLNIEANGRPSIPIAIEGSAGIVLDNLTLTDETDSKVNAIKVIDSRYITISNGTFSSCQKSCLLTARSNDLSFLSNHSSYSGEHGIYVSDSSDSIVISGNSCFQNERSGIQVNAEKTYKDQGDGLSTGVVIEKNLVWNNKGNGLNLLGVQSSSVVNNLLVGNGVDGGSATGGGIVLAKVAAADGPKSNKIYNNTVIMPSGSRFALQLASVTIGKDEERNLVKNNVLYHPQGKAIEYASTQGTVSDEAYNLFKINSTDTTKSLKNSTVDGLGKLFAQVAAPDTGEQLIAEDYRLVNNSQFIGTDLAEVTTDLLGKTRLSGNTTIGALQN